MYLGYNLVIFILFCTPYPAFKPFKAEATKKTRYQLYNTHGSFKLNEIEEEKRAKKEASMVKCRSQCNDITNTLDSTMHPSAVSIRS